MIKSKRDWDSVDQKAFFDEVCRVAETGTVEEKRAKYAQLGFVIENERGPMLVTEAQFAKWHAVIASLHEAYYGFAPARLSHAQIMSALSIDEKALDQTSALLNDLFEAMDGANLKQLVRAAKKELATAGIKIAPKLLTRLVAAFEGFPIPPA